MRHKDADSGNELREDRTSESNLGSAECEKESKIAGEPSNAPETIRLTNDDFPVVGIGASAGGLQALEEFFSEMPANPGIALVVISHLDPHHESILHELLRRSTALTVEQVRRDMRLEANHVYVGPPGLDVELSNDLFHLSEPRETRAVRLPIDHWFRSLARAKGEKAIGIILSGTGSDGTLGIKAIKGESGMTMAQQLDTARFEGMPSSAIATGLVDFVLPASEMPRALLRYAHRPFLSEAEAESGGPADHVSHLGTIFDQLRTRTGHDFAHYKHSTLSRRIARRMNIHQIDDHDLYVRYLKENVQEVDLLFKELLIGVTSFFRDRPAFDELAGKVLPELLRSRVSEAPIRVWVPGCSTGEEPYSLAILLREVMDRVGIHFDLQVFATDLDARAIEIARTGVYPDGIAVDIEPQVLQRYFVRDGDRYRIRKVIRESVVFAVQNLIRDPPFTRLDLVSCRNVLIYLQTEVQKRLMPLFHYALKPGGVLFLGTSETIGEHKDLFEIVGKRWKVFRRKGGATYIATAAEFPAMRGATLRESPSQVETPSKLVHHNIAELAARTLSERFAPPTVIVSDNGNIVFIHGQTGRFLEPSPGQPSHNILNMAREGLTIPLSAALRKAHQSEEDVVHSRVDVKMDGGQVSIELTVSKIRRPEALRGLLMVTFDPIEHREPISPERVGAGDLVERPDHEVSLESELQLTKENLQSTIEELEASNEELKSTNEELQSTNEEMQSANEELETTKEEMQSLNEELQTVNSELQGKIEQLSQTNDDMINLLNATDIATIFLDNDLCIKRFTEQATRVIRLIQSDIGRPISDIVSKLNYEDLEKDAREVLRTLALKEADLLTKSGTWYLMRMMPYRTTENVIDGLVLTFVDIDALKKAERALEKTNEEIRADSTRLHAAETALRDSEEHRCALFDLVSDAVLLIDVDAGVIVDCNKRAHEGLGYTREQFDQLGIAEISDEASGLSFTQQISRIAGEGQGSFESRLRTRSGERRHVVVSARALDIPGRNLVSSVLCGVGG